MNSAVLENYLALLLEIDLLEEEKQRLMNALISPLTYSNMPHAKNQYYDPTGETAAKLIEIKDIMNKKLDRLIDTRMGIELTMQQLSPEARNLLTMRYLLGYGWEAMAEKMHFTYQWIHVLHRRALKEWETFYDGCRETQRGA